MKNETKDLILNIFKIPNSSGLLMAIKEYDVDGEKLNPFKEKFYKLSLDDNFDLVSRIKRSAIFTTIKVCINLWTFQFNSSSD